MPKKSGRDKETDARIAFKTSSKPRKTYSGIVKTPRSINELLAQNSLATRITHKLSAQKSWTEWLRAVLPPELATHILHAVPKERELVVFADTSAWSVRLRYAAAGIVPVMQQRDPNLTRINVRVGTPNGLLP